MSPIGDIFGGIVKTKALITVAHASNSHYGKSTGVWRGMNL
jgi:hypothetical protein